MLAAVWFTSLKWQKSSGALIESRNEIAERNKEIKNKKKNGTVIDNLMKEYYLSYDTIKSIVYRKK